MYTDILIIDRAVCIAVYHGIIQYLHRPYKGVKWFLTICQKKTIISINIQHQFWCHSSNKFIIFPHLWEMWLLKSIKFILNHTEVSFMITSTWVWDFWHLTCPLVVYTGVKKLCHSNLQYSLLDYLLFTMVS